MTALDHFLATHARPVLLAAGFRQEGRRFLLDGPAGRTAVVGFYATGHDDSVDSGVAFACQYGVVTQTLRSWFAHSGVPQSGVLSPADALLMADLDAPRRPGPVSRVPRSDWHAERDSFGALGSQLADALFSTVVPTLRSWFDPAVLAEAIDERVSGRSAALSPVECAVAMAHYELHTDTDGGSSDLLRASLAILPGDHPVRLWIESRVPQPPRIGAIRRGLAGRRDSRAKETALV